MSRAHLLSSGGPCSPVWAWGGHRAWSPPRLPDSGDTRVPRRDVRQKVQLAVAQAFGIDASALHLTKPTFFSRINSTAARTAHDEYWHAHVDKVGHAGGGPRQWAPPRCL